MFSCLVFDTLGISSSRDEAVIVYILPMHFTISLISFVLKLKFEIFNKIQNQIPDYTTHSSAPSTFFPLVGEVERPSSSNI